MISLVFLERVQTGKSLNGCFDLMNKERTTGLPTVNDLGSNWTGPLSPGGSTG